MLNGLAGAAERAESEIAGSRDPRATCSRAPAAAGGARRGPQQAAHLGILAGTWCRSPGPGIRVTIDEPDGAVGIDSMLDTVQELRDGRRRGDGVQRPGPGGRADLVRRRRSAASSVDGTAASSAPYVIDVIGEPPPGTAAGLLSGPIDQLEDDGATVDVEELDESVEIDRRSGAPDPRSSPSPRAASSLPCRPATD